MTRSRIRLARDLPVRFDQQFSDPNGDYGLGRIGQVGGPNLLGSHLLKVVE